MTIDLSQLTPSQLIALQKQAEAMVSEDQKFFLNQKEKWDNRISKAQKDLEEGIEKVNSYNRTFDSFANSNGKLLKDFITISFSNSFPTAVCKTDLEDLLFYSESLRHEYSDIPYRVRESSEFDSSKYGEKVSETLEVKVPSWKTFVLKESIFYNPESNRKTAYALRMLANKPRYGSIDYSWEIARITYSEDPDDSSCNKMQWSMDLNYNSRGKKDYKNLSTAILRLKERYLDGIVKDFNNKEEVNVQEMIDRFMEQFNKDCNSILIQKTVQRNSYRSSYSGNPVYEYQLISKWSKIQLGEIRFCGNREKYSQDLTLSTGVNVTLVHCMNTRWIDINLTDDVIETLEKFALVLDEQYQMLQTTKKALDEAAESWKKKD